LPNFFIEQQNIDKNRIFITQKSDINHILNVLRADKKDTIILIGPDNKIYESQIKVIHSDSIECEILGSYVSDKALKINITLAQSIIKSQKQDFLIQKATELGVKEIIPFISRNTVVKPDKSNKIKRWQKIVYESAKQCQRGDLAKISDIISFEEVLKLDGFDLRVLCSEKKADITIKQFLVQNPHKSNILLIIGPEGGWDDCEIEKFLKAGITPVSLGKLVYRAETAAVTAISQIIYEYEL